MNTKNDVEVIINGKQYTLSGYESNEYMQKIASHINDKFVRFREQEGYNKLDADMKGILLAINLCDDYYKARKTADDLRAENEDMEKEIFNMKHDIISMKAEIEALESKLATLAKQKEEADHKIIRLETELGKSNEEYFV